MGSQCFTKPRHNGISFLVTNEEKDTTEGFMVITFQISEYHCPLTGPLISEISWKTVVSLATLQACMLKWQRVNDSYFPSCWGLRAQSSPKLGLLEGEFPMTIKWPFE